jgi:hypothetical protein
MQFMALYKSGKDSDVPTGPRGHGCRGPIDGAC